MAAAAIWGTCADGRGGKAAPPAKDVEKVAKPLFRAGCSPPRAGLSASCGQIPHLRPEKGFLRRTPPRGSSLAPSGQSACRKSLFARLLNFLKLQKSFKKLFDPTRKGTLTVPFHTILPSESFGWRVYRQSLLPLRGNSPCVAGENGFQFFRACGREFCEAFSRRMSNRGLRPQPAMNRVFRNREKMPGRVSRATARSATMGIVCCASSPT